MSDPSVVNRSTGRQLLSRGLNGDPEEAILDLLRIPFDDPEDPDLYRRRQRLAEQFKRVDPSRAAALRDRLCKDTECKRRPKRKEEISLLFWNLSTSSRKQMIGILDAKIKTYRQTSPTPVPDSAPTPTPAPQDAPTVNGVSPTETERSKDKPRDKETPDEVIHVNPPPPKDWNDPDDIIDYVKKLLKFFEGTNTRPQLASRLEGAISAAVVALAALDSIKYLLVWDTATKSIMIREASHLGEIRAVSRAKQMGKIGELEKALTELEKVLDDSKLTLTKVTVPAGLSAKLLVTQDALEHYDRMFGRVEDYDSLLADNKGYGKLFEVDHLIEKRFDFVLQDYGSTLDRANYPSVVVPKNVDVAAQLEGYDRDVYAHLTKTQSLNKLIPHGTEDFYKPQQIWDAHVKALQDMGLDKRRLENLEVVFKDLKPKVKFRYSFPEGHFDPKKWKAVK